MNLLWLLGLACLSTEAVGSHLFEQFKRDHNRRLCGNYLAKALSLACNGAYREWPPYANKRSLQLAVTDLSQDYYYEQPFEEASWPVLSRETAAALSQKGRYRRGVVDECCKKICSTEELRSYCAAD